MKWPRTELRAGDRHAKGADGAARAGRWIVWLLLLGLGPGCQTMSWAPNASARVVIYGCTQRDVADAVFAVFKEAGYEYLPQRTTELIFEKQGTSAQTAAHGGWLGGPVWYRVKVRVMPTQGGSQTLEAVAYRVEDHGDTTVEKETALPVRQKKDYQKLLDQVEKRVMSKEPGAAAPAPTPAAR